MLPVPGSQILSWQQGNLTPSHYTTDAHPPPKLVLQDMEKQEEANVEEAWASLFKKCADPQSFPTVASLSGLLAGGW